VARERAEDYLWWQMQNKKTIKRINLLFRDIQRSPFNALDKPEPLKENMSGWWSRRIDGNIELCIVCYCEQTFFASFDFIDKFTNLEVYLLFVFWI